MDTNKNNTPDTNENMETNQPQAPGNLPEKNEFNESPENDKNQDILPNHAVQGTNPDKQQKLHNWKNILILILMLIAFILGFQFLMSFMVIR